MSNKYKDISDKALKILMDIIETTEDEKVKISAIKEVLSVTIPKKEIKLDEQPLVIIKGDVED